MTAAKSNIGAINFYTRRNFIVQKIEVEDVILTKTLKRIVAIHQPNLFPWLGFFDKINKSDCFIILDHVINRPNDSIYTKRVTILNNNLPYWLTIPLLKPKGIEFMKIKDMKINLEDKFSIKHLKTIEHTYKKAKYYDEIIPLIYNFYNSKSEYISIRNLDFIFIICNKLNIKTRFYYSSELDSKLNATDLLIDLTLKINGNVYLAGGGAEGYQINQMFENSSLGLVYQKFSNPIYNQLKSSDFITGLSIIDNLMNIGFEGTKELLDNEIIKFNHI
ncbi:MAG: WbqC family protein [Saprospiraceae bacterium]|uniref:WbqC family protein n=1 Tax=Candidatus Defluviibacterium haderslevense TaxID=2981993 RepID=A0A9D7S7U6_9BACT|nr:WbqC family protein [Candidatus Defluviibacterium haderslevense]